MLWKVDGVLMKSPSTYKDNIEDVDNNSYTSAVTGALIDNVIAKGMIKAEFSFDYLTEEEAEYILAQTFKNPMNVTLKAPSITGGMMTAKFRCSSRTSEMLKTGNNENVSESRWKVAFNLMQKEKIDGQ